MSETNVTARNTSSWVLFSAFSFVVSAGMMAGGIFFMEASFAAKGFYAMAAIMLVHTSISLTKTLRDKDESERLVNKLDEARTERLLREVGEAHP